MNTDLDWTLNMYVYVYEYEYYLDIWIKLIISSNFMHNALNL